jgi:hypothetical protein
MLTKGLTYTLRIAGGGQINNNNRQEVAAYLDANNNNIFEASELVAGTGLHNNTTIRQYTFTVPATATTGNTRLRIVMLKQGQTPMSACPPTGLRGEVEDYLVNIVAPAASISDENIDMNIPVDEDKTQNSFTLMAKCKENVTKYTLPWDCSLILNVADIDDGSTGYDTLYYSVFYPPQIGIPHTYKLKAVTNEGDAEFCFSVVTFLDTIAPVAVVKENMVMTFLTTDSIMFTADMFNNGSYDYCTPITITMDPPYVKITDPSPLSVKVIVTDTFGNTSTAYTTVDIVDKSSGSPSASKDFEIPNNLVVPNPAMDFIKINAESELFRSLIISNTLGQVVLYANDGIQNEINISSLSSGQYLLRIQKKDGQILTSKFIKL